MLIDFKIRALFIWTDPYLPDLALTGQVANAVSSTSPSVTQRSRRLDLDHKQ